MTRILILDRPGEADVAVTDADGCLIDYALWRPGTPDGIGDLHRGRVIRRAPAMAGTFVAIDGAEGFLPDTAAPAGLGPGSALAVRVVRAAQGGKGPRLAADAAECGAGQPALIARGPDPATRLRARHPGAEMLAEDAAWAARASCRLARRADHDDVREQIATLAQKDVRTSDGGTLRFSPTPALVAIDVDLGARATGPGEAAREHLAANRALLPELARHIRLRNLSGAILVDFAGLGPRGRSALGADLSAALVGDPVGTRLLGFTRLGLAELVRPRIAPPLHELLAGPLAEALRALAAIEAEARERPGRWPTLRASVALAAALDADGFASKDLARRNGRALVMRSDPTLAPLGWRLEAS